MPPSVDGEAASGGEIAGVGDPGARLLVVGRIVRPHGLHGEVVVDLVSNRSERLEPGSALRDHDGRTYRVVRARPHRNRFLVRFEGVASIDDAERRRGVELLAAPMRDAGALWVHELIGARVEDPGGTVLGVVAEVQANPASDLLVLDNGGLVPLRFVVGTTPGTRVVVDVPDGLLDEG